MEESIKTVIYTITKLKLLFLNYRVFKINLFFKIKTSIEKKLKHLFKNIFSKYFFLLGPKLSFVKYSVMLV